MKLQSKTARQKLKKNYLSGFSQQLRLSEQWKLNWGYKNWRNLNETFWRFNRIWPREHERKLSVAIVAMRTIKNTFDEPKRTKKRDADSVISIGCVFKVRNWHSDWKLKTAGISFTKKNCRNDWGSANFYVTENFVNHQPWWRWPYSHSPADKIA